MKTMTIILITGLLCPNCFAGDAYSLWKEAKRHWYDGEWAKAAQTYELLLEKHPDSPYQDKSMYFLAYCEEKMEHHSRAFEILSDLIDQRGSQADDNVIEDAKSLRLLIAFKQVDSDPSFKEVLKQSLRDRSKDIRMQAATNLAKLGDRSGISELFKILENEDDTDIRDVVIKHVLLVANEKDKKRLDALLESQRGSEVSGAPRMLRLVVRDLNSDNEALRVNVPEKLLHILLRSLTPEQRELIEQNHVDLDLLAKEMRNMPRHSIIFEIKDQNQEIKLILD